MTVAPNILNKFMSLTEANPPLAYVEVHVSNVVLPDMSMLSNGELA